MYPSSYNIASYTPLFAQAPVFVPSSVSQQPVQQMSSSPQPCPSPPQPVRQVAPAYSQPSQAPMRCFVPASQLPASMPAPPPVRPWQPQMQPVTRPQLSLQHPSRPQLQCGPCQQPPRHPNPNPNPQLYPPPYRPPQSQPVTVPHPPSQLKSQPQQQISSAVYYPQSTSPSVPYTNTSLYEVAKKSEVNNARSSGFGGNPSIRDQQSMYQTQYMQSTAQHSAEDFTVPLTEPEKQRLFSQFQDVLGTHGTLDVCDHRLLSVFMQLPAPIRRGIKRLGGLKPFLQQAEEFFIVEGDNVSLRLEEVHREETSYDPAEWEDSRTEDFFITEFIKAPDKSDSKKAGDPQDGEDAESASLWEICSFLTSDFGSGGGYYDDYKALFPDKKPTFEGKKQEKSPFLDMGDKLAAKAKEVQEERILDNSVSVRVVNPAPRARQPSPYICMGDRLASKAKEISTEDAKNNLGQLATAASSERTQNSLTLPSYAQGVGDDLSSPLTAETVGEVQDGELLQNGGYTADDLDLPATEAVAEEQDSELLQNGGCTAEDQDSSEAQEPLRGEEANATGTQMNRTTRPKMASILSGLATASGQGTWIQHLKSLASREKASDSEEPDNQVVEESSDDTSHDQQELGSNSSDLASNASLEEDLENVSCTPSADQVADVEQVAHSCAEANPSEMQETDPSVDPGHILEDSPDWPEDFAEGPVAVKDSCFEQIRPDAEEPEATSAIQPDKECQENDCETWELHPERPLNHSRTSSASQSPVASKDPLESDQQKSQQCKEDAASEGDYESTNTASGPKESKEVVEPYNCHSCAVEDARPDGLSTNPEELEIESPEDTEEACSLLQDQESKKQDGLCQDEHHLESKSSGNTSVDLEWLHIQELCAKRGYPCTNFDAQSEVDSNGESESDSCETAELEREEKTEPEEAIDTSNGFSRARRSSETSLQGLAPSASEEKARDGNKDIPSNDKDFSIGLHVSQGDRLEVGETVDNWEDLIQDQGDSPESEEDMTKESPRGLREDLYTYQQSEESCTEQDEECNQIPVSNKVSESSVEAINKNVSLAVYPEEQTPKVLEPHQNYIQTDPLLVEGFCSPDASILKEETQNEVLSSSQDATTLKIPAKMKHKGVSTDEIRMCTRAISTKKIVTRNFGVTTEIATTVNRAVDTPAELEEMYMRRFVEAVHRVSILEDSLQCERDLMASQKNKYNMELRKLKDTHEEKSAQLMDVERELEVKRRHLTSELKKKTLEHRELESLYSHIKSKFIARENENASLYCELERVTRQLLDLEKVRDTVIPKAGVGTDTQELDKAQEYSDGVRAERMVALLKRAKTSELELLQMKRQSIEQQIQSALNDAEYTYNIYAGSTQLSFPEKAHLVTKWTEYQNMLQTHVSRLGSKYSSLVRMIKDEDKALAELPELVAPKLEAFTVPLPKHPIGNHPAVMANPPSQPQPHQVFRFSAQPLGNPHTAPSTTLPVPPTEATREDVHPDNQEQSNAPRSAMRQPARTSKAVGRGRGRRLSNSQHKVRRPGEHLNQGADGVDQSCPPSKASAPAAAATASEESMLQNDPVKSQPSEMPDAPPLSSHQTDLPKKPSASEKEALPQGFRFGGPSGDRRDLPVGLAEEQTPTVEQPVKQQHPHRSHSEHISNMQKRMRSASLLSRLKSTFSERPHHQTGFVGTHTVGHSARKMNLLAAPLFCRKTPLSQYSEEMLSERSAEVAETSQPTTSPCGTFGKSSTGKAPKEVTAGSCEDQCASEVLQESLSIPSSDSDVAGVGASQAPVAESADNGRNSGIMDRGNPCEVPADGSHGSQSNLTPAQRISEDWRSHHTDQHLTGPSEGIQSNRQMGSEAPVPSGDIQSQPSVFPTPSRASSSNPEPSVNTADPPVSTPQPSMPSPGSLLPTSEPSVPSTKPAVPVTEPSKPITEVSFPTTESSVPTSVPMCSNPRTSYPNPQTSYPNPQPSYPNPQTSYPNPQISYPNPQISYPNPQTSYPNLQTSYPNPQTSYPNPQTSYPNPQISYPNPQTSYPNRQFLYPNPQPSYPNSHTLYSNPGPLITTHNTYVPTSAALLPTPGAFFQTPAALLPPPVPFLPSPEVLLPSPVPLFPPSERPLPTLKPLLPTPQPRFPPAASNNAASAVYNKEMWHSEPAQQSSTQRMKSDTDSASSHFTDGRTPLYQRSKQAEVPPRFQGSRRVQQQRRPSHSEDSFTAPPDPIKVESRPTEVKGLKKRKAPGLDQMAAAKELAKEAPVEEAEKDEWQTQLSKRKKKAIAQLEAEQRQQQVKAGKKGCMDKLITVLSDQFPNVKPKDMMDVIRQVRMDHNGSLSGTPFSTIIAESRLYLQAKTEPPRPQPSNPPQSAKPRARKLPTLQAIQQTVPSEDSDMCVICQEDMNSKSGDVRMLDCGHLFHDETVKSGVSFAKCISIWYNRRERTCPICRCHTLFAEDFPRLQ